MPKFTVIIPVYNGEQTIGRAIESVIRQSYNDWELVIVNDGSTDNTGCIVSSYSSEDSRIKKCKSCVVPSGSAAARQQGLDVANGDWIVWLDADDFVDSDLLSTLDSVSRDEADLIMYGYLRHSEDCVSRISRIISYSNMAGLFDNYVNSSFHGLPFMASRRSLWNENEIRFIKGANFCEDLNVTMKLLSVAKNIRCLDYTPYHYIDNPTSICNNLSPEHMHQRQLNILDMYDFVRKQKCYPEIAKAISPLVLAAKQPFARKHMRQYVETAKDMNRYILSDKKIPLHKKLYLLAIVITYPLWK